MSQTNQSTKINNHDITCKRYNNFRQIQSDVDSFQILAAQQRKCLPTRMTGTIDFVCVLLNLSVDQGRRGVCEFSEVRSEE